MTTLGQRIDNILGPWPTPDQVREAFLLLARHLQRHDELVSARVTWQELRRFGGGETTRYHGRECVIPAIAEYTKEEN